MKDDRNATARPRPRMSRLLAFLAFHALLGVLLALLTMAAILYFDVAHIASLTRGKPYGATAVFALTTMLCVTFGSAQISFAVFSVGFPNERTDDAADEKKDEPTDE